MPVSIEPERGQSDRPSPSRRPKNGLVALLEEGVDTLVLEARKALSKPRETPEEKLVKEVQARRVAIRHHASAYIFVNAFLLLVNALTVAGSGVWWFLLVAGGWGVGLGIHAVNHFFWIADRRREIAQAERALEASVEAWGDMRASGVERALEPGVPRRVLASTNPPAVEHEPVDPAWADLMARVRRAAEGARSELHRLGAQGRDAADRLDEGLADAVRLHEGADRLALTVRGLAPEGAQALSAQLEAIEGKRDGAEDPRLRNAYASNAELLRALQGKVAAIDQDRERMRISVEGFLLSAQNLQIDAARLSAGDPVSTDFSGVEGPTARLAEEVTILRTVEDELRSL